MIVKSILNSPIKPIFTLSAQDREKVAKTLSRREKSLYSKIGLKKCDSPFLSRADMWLDRMLAGFL